jgi:hypothetical protein
VIHVWGDGESSRVNCLTGAGVSQFRESLMAYTRSMPWFGEVLPSSWVQTKSAILELAGSRPFLAWQEYRRLAEQNKMLGHLLISGTRFLHETGVLRYFGNVDLVASTIEGRDDTETLDRNESSITDSLAGYAVIWHWGPKGFHCRQVFSQHDARKIYAGIDKGASRAIIRVMNSLFLESYFTGEEWPSRFISYFKSKFHFHGQAINKPST